MREKPGTNSGEEPDGIRIRHEPALLTDVINSLALVPGITIIDGTVGSAGHFGAVVRRIGPRGIGVGLDRDSEALDRTRVRIEEMQLQGVELHLVHASFSELGRVADDLSLDSVDRILLDLGLSLEQLTDPGRGFSFLRDGPLDMRQDRRQPLTASDVVNEYPPEDLLQVVREYGEERHAVRIVRAITERRRERRIEGTLELAGIIESAVPGGRGRIHPATRTFQALRIEVGGEHVQLCQGLPQAAELLGIGGRLAIITFHGLEDRTVKQALRPYGRHGGRTDWRLVRLGRVIRPSPEEVACNPRSRSAKLRVFEKVAV